MIEQPQQAVPVPERIKRLPRWGSYPVPFFVQWYEGPKRVRAEHPNAKPDFRVISTTAFAACIRRRVCWICGQPLGAIVGFVSGPVSCLGRGSSEPPSHRACAEYAARACPHLANPGRERREGNLPADTVENTTLAGHNPGVTGVYITRSWRLGGGEDPDRAVDFVMGPAMTISWWREGRPATRREILVGMEKSLLHLIEGIGVDMVLRLFDELEPHLPPECFP